MYPNADSDGEVRESIQSQIGQGSDCGNCIVVSVK